MKEGTANGACRNAGLSGYITLESVHAMKQISLPYVKDKVGVKRACLHSMWKYKLHIGK